MSLRVKLTFLLIGVFAALGIAGLTLALCFGERRAMAEGAALVLAAIAAGAGLAVLFVRRMLRQIAELHAATVRMKGGEAGVRCTVRSTDELGELAEEFNAMAGEIERQRATLTEQNQSLEAARRSYLETVGFVSHELRSNLGSAVFNAEAVREGAYGPLGPGPQEGLLLVRHSLSYMGELMANYLQLQRIERGELLLKKIPVRLARDVIRPAVGALELSLRARAMRLELAVPEDVSVLADPALLRVVYENLIGNAIKFGAEGGVIRVGAERQQNRVLLEVWNEGAGLPADRLPMLFHKFQRFDVDAPQGRHGTGLGLYIVKQIISQHGGEIAASSEAGRWLRIAFSLEASLPPEL